MQHIVKNIYVCGLETTMDEKWGQEFVREQGKVNGIDWLVWLPIKNGSHYYKFRTSLLLVVARFQLSVF